MKGWLLDTYRSGNRIVLWIKTPEKNLRIVKRYRTSIYLECSKDAKAFINRHRLPHYLVLRKNHLRKPLRVFELYVPELNHYEKFVQWIETETKHQINLYNADIPPEQLYLYEHDLSPGQPVEVHEHSLHPLPLHDEPIPLTRLELDLSYHHESSPSHHSQITRITANNLVFEGDEYEVLSHFSNYFQTLDPDIILARRAFCKIPHLAHRLRVHGIPCMFHRWDSTPLTYKGGKSYYSYGRVHYQDHAVRLHGRFLIDRSSFIGSACETDAIMELCQVTGTRFQQLASRSFGAAFHSHLVKILIQHDLLVPYKEKPIERPMSLLDLLKADRVGHTFDPKIGFHTRVAELDFASMFPWIMHNFNISADTLLNNEPPLVDVPGLPIRISHHHKGFIPIAILPFITRRMHYKEHPTNENRIRAAGLKWVLVSSYGYLRFREFKLGIAQSHMAVGAYAREILLKSAELAEEHGYELIHGIIDSLYLKKRNMAEDSVRALAEELSRQTGIPLAFEGIFKWIVFLPSINNKNRPLPARYYGVFTNGKIKARGIELRQKGACPLVKSFQQQIITLMAECTQKKDIIKNIPRYCNHLRETIATLPHLPPTSLTLHVCASKTDYQHNVPQKKTHRTPSRTTHRRSSRAAPLIRIRPRRRAIAR